MHSLFYILGTIVILLMIWFNMHSVEYPDATHFFANDVDNYFGSLTKHDLIARNVATKQEYTERAIKALRPFNKQEKKRLHVLCRNANRQLKKYPHVPWKLVLTEGRAYENGYPHTRASYVFLSTETMLQSDTELISTLVHEKVHLIQRMYPEIAEKYLTQRGFKKHVARAQCPMCRSNPDLDPWIYEHNGQPCMYIYKERPNGINDCIHYGTTEHPYEYMAYEIQRSLGA